MRMMIDRIEQDFIIAELPDGQILNLPRALLPDAAEGQVYLITRDTDDERARQVRIQAKMDRLFVD